MKLSATENRDHFRSLAVWMRTPAGRAFAERETVAARDVIGNCFGYHLAIIGDPIYASVGTGSRILNVSLFSPLFSALIASVVGETVASGGVCDPGRLPIANDSVDVVVLPHVLEFSESPHDVLREVERVLVPEGLLVLIGFNPFGALGMWRMLRFALRAVRTAAPGGESESKVAAPWTGRFFSSSRIKDWLALLGFDVQTVRPIRAGSAEPAEATDHAAVRAPETAWWWRLPGRGSATCRCPGETGSKATLAERLFSDLAASQLYVARKRVSTLTPVRQRWRAGRRLVSVGLAGPSVRAAARTMSAKETAWRPMIVPADGRKPRS